MNRFSRIVAVSWMLSLGWVQPAHALDSYRYLHVTIETPWSIFLFLLIGIFAPFVLMGILAWRYSGQRKPNADKTPQKTTTEP